MKCCRDRKGDWGVWVPSGNDCNNTMSRCLGYEGLPVPPNSGRFGDLCSPLDPNNPCPPPPLKDGTRPRVRRLSQLLAPQQEAHVR
jgi:hypothetical protein